MHNNMKSVNSFAKMYGYNSDITEDMPTLKYFLNPKLHGTNGSIVLKKSGRVYARSKNRVLSLEKDHMSFAHFVAKNNKEIRELINDLHKELVFDFETDIILFGEWCGQGIHRGANDAACHLEEKTFFIYAVQNDDLMFTNFESVKCKVPNTHLMTPMKEIDISFLVNQGVQTVVEKINKCVYACEEVDPYLEDRISALLLET